MIKPGEPSPLVVIQDGDGWWRYADLVREVRTVTPADVPAALAIVESAVEQDGLLAAGFMTYEAAAAFDLSVHTPDTAGLPLLWFGLFRRREPVQLDPQPGGFRFGTWEPRLCEADYIRAVDHIKDAIARGDTYQANFTFPMLAAFEGDPWALYVQLNLAQRATYTAYLDLGRYVVVSASPELFFTLDGDHITSRPMKGTAPRGLTAADDLAQIEWLQSSEKNRAENVMIVDMIRNDIGRVARTGTVNVPELFAVERYPTLLQMTSTVEATTDASLPELMAAMFPCASITGAPKVSTMTILRELEPQPRGIYTGMIGHILPGRRMQFNVAIRTAIIDRQAEMAAYHVGSGVVWDSDAAAEYQECLLKARVLAPEVREPGVFELLESLLWTPERGFVLLERHLARLAASAGYFDFDLDVDLIRSDLAAAATSLAKDSKVRLLVNKLGRVTITAEPLADGERPLPLRVGLATEPIYSGDRWLYHKTTVRHMYDEARASRPDCDDVILWNERGELTESSVANLLVELDGRWLTPPIASGLLPGTMRAELLDAGEIVEQPLLVTDLARATQIMLVNSVRGRIPALWLPA